MPTKSRRLWTPIIGFWQVPVVETYGKDDEATSSYDSSCPESVKYDDPTDLWSRRIKSDILAMLALAPASAHEQILDVELGQDSKGKEAELNIVITELSASDIVVLKSVSDKPHTVWKVRTSTDSSAQPTWRYRYPRKPIEMTIPPNPNISEGNGPPRKTRRSIRRKFERSMIIGKSEIKSWKRGAGRSKEWRKYRDINISDLQAKKKPDSESQENASEYASRVPWLFSTITVPLSLLRAQSKKPIQGRKKEYPQRKLLQAGDFTLRYVGKDQTLEIAQRIRQHREVHASWKRHFAPGWRPRPLQDVRTIRAPQVEPPPQPRVETAADFLRLVISVRGETKVIPETFLTGEVTISASTNLQSQKAEPGNPEMALKQKFLVSGFQRHESHADVYTLENHADPVRVYEGHLFFHEDMPGNWGKYSKRKMERLQKSRGFIGETKLKERILIVHAPLPDETVRIKKSDAEFPVLPKADTEPSSIKSRSKKKKKRPSYATIAGSNAGKEGDCKNLKHPSNHIAYQAWKHRNQTTKKWKPNGTYHNGDQKSRETNRRGVFKPGGLYRPTESLKGVSFGRQWEDLQQKSQTSSYFESVNPFDLLNN